MVWIKFTGLHIRKTLLIFLKVSIWRLLSTGTGQALCGDYGLRDSRLLCTVDICPVMDLGAIPLAAYVGKFRGKILCECTNGCTGCTWFAGGIIRIRWMNIIFHPCIKHFMGYGVPVSGKDRTLLLLPILTCVRNTLLLSRRRFVRVPCR